MSAFRSFLGGLFGKQDATEQSPDAEPDIKSRPAFDIVFDERNTAEAELLQLWRRCELHVQQGEQASKALRPVVASFVKTFEHWQPNESVFSGDAKGLPSRRSAGATLAGSEAEDVRWLRGCVGGHPKKVLVALVAALEQIPSDFAQVARRETARPEELQSAVGTQVLEALAIAARSHHNCTQLLQLDAFASLARLMKVAISRLNAMAAMAGTQGSIATQAGQLQFLQFLLANVVSVVETFVRVEVRACTGPLATPLMERYLPNSEVMFCSKHPREPGSRQQAETMDAILQPLLEAGILSFLLEVLRLLSLLRSRGACVLAMSEELVLECLLAIVSASGAAAGYLYNRDADRCGLLVLVEALGVSSADLLDPAESYAHRAETQRSAEEELRFQLITLQCIGGALKRNRANLQLFHECGGFLRITKLLHWVALTFPAASPSVPALQHWPTPPGWADSAPQPLPHALLLDPPAPGTSAQGPNFSMDAAARSSTEASTSGRGSHSAQSSRGSRSGSPSQQLPAASGQPGGNQDPGGGSRDELTGGSGDAVGRNRVAQPLGGGTARAPECAALAEIFCVLESWLSLKEARSAGQQEREHWARLFHGIAKALLDAFQPAISMSDLPPKVSLDVSSLTAAVNALYTRSTSLQHYTLAFLSHLLEASPGSLPALRSMGYLDMLFGPAFFFFGHRTASLLSKFAQEASQARGDGHERRSDEAAGSENWREGGDLESIAEDAASGDDKEARTLKDTGHLGTASPGAVQASDTEELKALRWRVVQLVEQAACVKSEDSNEAECGKLVELLELWVLEAHVVLAAAPALGRILRARRELTLVTLEKLDALGTLAKGARRQQQSEEAAQAVLTGLEPSVAAAVAESPEAVASWEARGALLSLLAALLDASPKMQRRAVRTWDTVAALFGLLREARMRDPALRMVVALMCMVPESEDDALAKTALFTKFVEVLPTALSNWRTHGLGMVFVLLTAIEHVVAASPQQHQNLFRKAECFVQIVHLLNLDYPPDLGSLLCCHVLATLTALLAGNEASRNRVRDDVGYDTLHSIITRLVGPRGPSQELLLRILGLVLEGDYKEDVGGQTVGNANAVPLMFRCLRQADRGAQTWGLRVWQRLLQGNMANLSACERAHVNSLLIDWFAASEADPQLQTEIAAVLELSGAYSITGRDLRAIFALLKQRPDGTVPAHSRLLLQLLTVMAQHEGPTAFFDFSNQTAGLIRTTSLRFPGSKGYTFATWLRLEDSRHEDGTAGRLLYSLLSTSGNTAKGVSAVMRGNKLVVFCVSPKLAEVELSYEFAAKRWYHVAVTHSAAGALTPSTVRLFVNGEEHASARFRFPKVTDALNECSIAARLSSVESDLGAPVNAFSGQMGCIYLFEDILSNAQVGALCDLGPDYQSVFLATETAPALDQAATAASLVVDGKEALAPVLLMSYNAQAAAGRMLYDTSDMDRGSAEDGGMAAMLEGTQLCCTCQLRDILHCLGGMAALLPLLAQLEAPSSDPGSVSESKAVDVVRLLSAILEDSPSNRQSMLQISGVSLASQLLQQCSPRHLTLDLLKALEGLCRAVRPAEELWQDVLRRLLLNLRLWSAADINTQRYLLQFFLKLAKAEPTVFRKLLGVPHLLDAIRAHYWLQPSPDSLRPVATGGQLLPDEMRELRRGLLHVARILLRLSVHHRAARISWADVQAFVSFVGDCSDTTLLEDVLSSLHDALRHNSPTHAPLVACLRSQGGERLFMSLLQREHQSLRLLGLQLLTAFVGPAQHLQPSLEDSRWASPELDDLKQRGFWTSVTDLLLMFPLTQQLRLVLLDMLCAGSPPPQAQARTGQQPKPLISAAPVVGILLRLLLGCDSARERLHTLEALHYLCVDGPKENRAAIVEQPGWEEWLLDLLLDGSPCAAPAERDSSAPQEPRGQSRSDNSTAVAQPGVLSGGQAGPGPLSSHLATAQPSPRPGSPGSRSPPDALPSISEGQQHNNGTGVSGQAVSLDSSSRRATSLEQMLSRGSSMERSVSLSKWAWRGREAELIRGMLRALHTHCIKHVPRGWTVLQHTACRLRDHAARGVVDGWGLMHSLLVDVVKELLGMADLESGSATADAWMMVSALATEPCRSNAVGLLGIIDELASGTLILPGDQPLRPPAPVVQWAEQATGQDVPASVWDSLGLNEAKDSMTPRVWQLYDATWQLIYVLHRALEGLASLGPDGERKAGVHRQGSLPQLGRGTASSGPSMPQGVDRRLDSLQALPQNHGSRDGSEDPLAERLSQSSARLLLRLLLRYLRSASLPNVEQCANNALLLIPVLIDPHSPTSRDYMHLLLAGLVQTAGQVETVQGEARRLQLICWTIQGSLKAAKDVYAAERLALPPLPPLEDPQYRVVVEGTLYMERVAQAARAEVLQLWRMAGAHREAMQALDAENGTRLTRERQLRHNLQEDARQALGLICTSERSRRATARVAAEEESQTLGRQWRNIQRSLCGAGGLWTAAESQESLHWKLDRHEDPSRRRMRMKRNYKFQFYTEPQKGGGSAAGADPTSPERIALPGVKRKTQDAEEDEPGAEEGPASPTKPGQVTPEKEANKSHSNDQAGSMPRNFSDESLGAQDEADADASKSAEDLQKLLYSTPCRLVSPKHVTPGVLRLTSTRLHFAGDVVCEDAAADKPKSGRSHKRWPIAAITELHHARFLLQPFALEIFLADRSNALLSFPSAEVAKEVARQLQGVTQRITVFDRKRKQDLALKLQQRWQRCEISNFDYIMQLNSLAGRTYNDLNQYPVFPWIIADYTSPTLDLNLPGSFRDLAKPVGALDEKRLQFFRERYEGLRHDPDTPPFHYGSHYSSAAIVLFYLVRLEPFTLLNRNIQGDRFDHADRLFHSIADTWQNCLQNSSDVKELTPEFFYQPEFLLNSNRYRLGHRQDGMELDDVALPPWANGSADEFVRIQREALESEHVSEHLHEWLDLIFGVKQQGRAAQEAFNVFYYLTYEGAVDLDEIEDPMQRKAVEDQISYFGQTPSQLFRRKHPKRGPPAPPANHPLLNGPEAMKLAVVGKPPARRPNIAVARMEVTDGRVVLINADRAVSCHRWLSPRDQAAFTFSTSVGESYSVEADSSPPRLLGTPFAADLDCGQCYAVLPGGQVIVSCGYWDNSIRCYNVDDGRLLQSLRQHKDIVTCIAVGSDGCTLVSGSRDTTLIIWDAVAGTRGGGRSLRGRAPSGQVLLRAQPRHLLYGHEDAVVCVALSPELDLVVSASAEGTVLFHTLNAGRHVRTLRLPGGVAPSLLALAPQLGVLVAHSWQDLGLHAFTINGRHLVTCEGNERLSAMAASPDGRFLLSGGAKGLVTLRWLHSLQVLLRYDAARGPITALTVTAEECILAGTADGSMIVFAPDPRRSITRRFDLADARPAGSSSAPPAPTIRFDT